MHSGLKLVKTTINTLFEFIILKTTMNTFFDFVIDPVYKIHPM